MINLTNIEFYKNPDDNWKEEIINGRNVNIPNDWNKNKINDCGKIITGNTPSTIDNQLWANFSEYKWISTPNLNNSIIVSSNRYLTKKGKEKGRSANKGSLLISCIGSIGECGILKEESFFNQQINAIEFNECFNNFYLKYFFNYKKNMFQNYVPKSIVPALNKEDFKKYNLYSPLIEEQKKIATILETQENLILSKKELLEKYKKQRKYFQQELLSGRIRMKLNNKSMSEAFELGLIKQTFLNEANEVVEYGGDTITNVNIDIIDKDGFESWLSIDFENKIEFYKNIDFKEEKINGRVIRVPNDWDRKLFKDYFISRMGETILNVNLIDNGKIPVYSATEEYKVFGYVNNSKFVLKENDLVIPARGNSIGFIKIINSNSTCTQTTIAASMINNNKYTSKYIFEYLMFLKLKKQIFNIEGGAIPQLTVKEMNDINIFIPNVIEQTLIAKQLTKIDNLIESLEEEIKLEDKKFTYLKQELLSGRIRVK